MIPKLFKAGKSFKGVFRYLATDPKANTGERVAWTHTLNCAFDHLPSAMDEMIWTARSADWLKRQAGVRTGGSPLKDPVRHFSLNWPAEEKPSREHMIETVESFLAYMKWNEHQAVLFCHTDKKHDHVHVVLNAVHPETGRTLDSGFDRSRAQRWALAYEQEHTLVCEQRLLPKGEREPAPTREAWQRMKQAGRQFEEAEAMRRAEPLDYFERADPALSNAKEWKALKGHQREEREQFFAGGKQAYRDVRNAVFREVRTEFRDQWKTWFRMRREGADLDLLGAIKDGILERQNAELETRRDVACAELRDKRDAEYKLLLEQQRDDRAQLRERQNEGRKSPDLLDAIYGVDASGRQSGRDNASGAQDSERVRAFNEAADEICEPASERRQQERRNEHKEDHEPVTEKHRVRDPANAIGDVGLGAIGALATIAERLLDGFLGGAEKPRARVLPPREQNDPQPRNDNSARAAEHQQRAAEAQAREAEQLHAFWQERKKRRRGRDRD